MPFVRITLTSSVVCLLLAGGCGPKVSQEDLGKVEFRIPHVAGAEEPYPFDQLKEPEVND